VGNMNIETISLFEEVKPALIYIPDISGFTQFISHTNIEYSKKLTHDLLEVIVDSNILNLKVAEIQGDSIFFYSLGTPPNITKLESQAKKTFLDFQKALQKMEEEHTLLKGAQKLTLKIVVHFGYISTTDIKGIHKLVGSDIILAHRLLKNNIPENEYVLMTDHYLKTQNEDLFKNSFSWSEKKEGKKRYDYFGTVSYKYISLTPLRKLVRSIY
jgi:hypothetical protein